MEKYIKNKNNRAFRYGDSLFESVKMIEGQILLLPYHLNRLLSGMNALKIEVPNDYDIDFFISEIKKVTLSQKNARIRLQVYRQDGGHYTPISNDAVLVIEAENSTQNKYEILEKGLNVGWYDQTPVFSKSGISRFKTGNALPYILASIHAKNYSLDDCFIFNEKGNIAEATSSNLFLIKNKQLITPSLDAGCVGGVMRRVIIEIAKKSKIIVKERLNVQAKDVFEADGIFLTNAIQGIKWVEQVEHTTFQRPYLIDFLNKKLNEFSPS